MFSSSLLGYLTGIIVKWSRLIGEKQQEKLTTYIPLEYTGETQENLVTLKWLSPHLNSIFS